jgi:hypothetical protein
VRSLRPQTVQPNSPVKPNSFMSNLLSSGHSGSLKTELERDVMYRRDGGESEGEDDGEDDGEADVSGVCDDRGDVDPRS